MSAAQMTPPTVRVTIPAPDGCAVGRALVVLVDGIDPTRRGARAILGERAKAGEPLDLAPGQLVVTHATKGNGHRIDLWRVVRGELLRLDRGTLDGGPDVWLPSALASIERAQAGAYDEAAPEQYVSVTVPPAPGRRGFTRERFTTAAIVRRVDRDQQGEAAIIGERLRGQTLAPIGALLVVYGEDRAPLTGELRAHVADLWQVTASGELLRVRKLTHAAYPDDDGAADWPPELLREIDAASRRNPVLRRRQPHEHVPLTRPAVALLLLVLALASSVPARADVRASAAWSAELAPGEWARLPGSVCGGALPSDYEAWSTLTGERVGDRRLFHGTSPARIVGNGWRGPVLAYVWCEPDEPEHVTLRGGVVVAAVRGVRANSTSRAPERLPWPWPRIVARAQGRV